MNEKTAHSFETQTVARIVGLEEKVAKLEAENRVLRVAGMHHDQLIRALTETVESMSAQRKVMSEKVDTLSAPAGDEPPAWGGTRKVSNYEPQEQFISRTTSRKELLDLAKKLQAKFGGTVSIHGTELYLGKAVATPEQIAAVQ